MSTLKKGTRTQKDRLPSNIFQGVFVSFRGSNVQKKLWILEDVFFLLRVFAMIRQMSSG